MVRPKQIGMAGFLVALASLGACAQMQGTAIAVQTTEQWYPGNLVAIDIPSLQKHVLVEGACFGPCFSVDGAQVAFILDDTIRIVNTDGTSPSPISTGIQCFSSASPALHGTPSEAVSVYWLQLDNDVGVGEYFYWVSQTGPTREDSVGGWFRARRGSSLTERLTEGDFFWGGVDPEGKRASAVDNWTVHAVDLTTGESRAYGSGCNASLSPDGRYLLHNLNRGEWNPDYKHTHCMIRDWETGETVRLLPSICTFDNHKWSHHDQNVVMWRTFDHYDICSGDAGRKAGVLCHLETGERIDMGEVVAYDFFPGEASVVEPRVAEPVFAPQSGYVEWSLQRITLTSSTLEAMIRYTTDGSTPTETHGSELAPGDSFDASLVDGQMLLVKAVAYKDGMVPSIVSQARYQALDDIRPFRLVSPNGGERIALGSTVPIEWETDPGASLEGLNIVVSVDGGIQWLDGLLSETLTPDDQRWGAYPWTIEQSGLTAPLCSPNVRLKIEVYGNESIYDVSDNPFEIYDASRPPLKRVGTPIVSVAEPTGGGSKDLGTIRDDRRPASGDYRDAYDTWDGTDHDEDYFGYVFTEAHSFTYLRYHTGKAGRFAQDVRIEVRVDGTWEQVQGVVSTPAYQGAQSQEWTSYLFSFGPIQGDGIRITGRPASANFVACAELDVWALPGETHTARNRVEAVLPSGAPRLSVLGPRRNGVSLRITGVSPTAITIRDLHGALVATIGDGDIASTGPGQALCVWDRRGRNERRVPPGVYVAIVVSASCPPSVLPFSLP